MGHYRIVEIFKASSLPALSIAWVSEKESKMETQRAKILLFGDLLRHVILEPWPFDPKKENSENGFIGHIRRAKNPLLPEMIREALSEEEPVSSQKGESSAPSVNDWDVTPNFNDMPDAGHSNYGFGEWHSILDRFPVKSSSREQDQKVLRVKSQKLATSTILSVDDDTDLSEERETYLRWVIDNVEKDLTIDSRSLNSRIGLLYDHNSRFRRSVYELKPPELARMSNLFASCEAGVILAIADNIEEVWLKKACDLCFPNEAHKDGTDRYVAVVFADALRKSDLGIMEVGALETSVNDIVAHLDKPPLSILQERCAHIVIVFREAGALHIDNRGGKLSLTFAPNYDRHAQMHPERYGSLPGKLTTIVTSIIRELYRVAMHPTKEHPLDIAAALRLGVIAYNVHFDFGLADNTKFAVKTPLDAFKIILGSKRRLHIKILNEQRTPEYLLTTLNVDLVTAKSRTWHRYDTHFSPGNSKTLRTEDSLLENLVRHGLDYEFRTKEESGDSVLVKPSDDKRFWTPEPVITIPYTEFGKIRMLDYEDIENYNNLSKIIDKYLRNGSWSTPLSIAVFGQPGSGKSFAVKQILKKVSPDRKSEPLTFNIAQFSSVDQLTEAFHKVQDSALSSPEVPLVIFDEFDSNLDGGLGWLKYFLAPMQDGLFRGRSQDYRVGRSIFLFSGGTSFTFEQFSNGSGSKEQDSGTKRTDFLSRLRGHLDVPGINPHGGDWSRLTRGERLKIRLRRAILLRSLIEEHASIAMQTTSDGLKVAQISSDLVQAFLWVSEYRHGVRSMEAMLQMARPIDGRLVTASLPMAGQFAAHVDSASFVRKLTRFAQVM